jgi:hypothetical protein
MMGLDAIYQALPDDWSLLAAAKEGDLTANQELEAALFFLLRFHGTGMQTKSKMMDTTSYAVCDLLQRHPHIAERNCRLDRRWDKLYFLLSSERRGSRPWPDDALAKQSIFGVRTLFELHYSPPAAVFDVAAFLERTTIADLYLNYDPERMAEGGVYKFHIEDAVVEWKILVSTFMEFRAFYQSTALVGNAVISLLF